MMKVAFQNRILVIGCGSVSQCFLPLLLRHVTTPPEQITVMDFVDNRARIADVLQAGVHYVIDGITRENLHAKLSEFVSRGDLIIDVAYNIDCSEILEWCHAHQIMYINTSVEEWEPYKDAPNIPPIHRTLYARQMKLRRQLRQWPEKGVTAVVDHGANPGLVSHFTKEGLRDIALKLLAEKPDDPRADELQDALCAKNFAKIAQLTGVKVIHISERDTQITNRPKEVNEFVNTWSIEGFYEEGIAPAEMGWGTHERMLPVGAHIHSHGPRNQICLAQMGIQTKVRSWVPCGEIVGMVIRHGEAFTISDLLTVREENMPVYRPTVHYAYCPCDSAIVSLYELEMRQFALQERLRILEDDIVSGRDELGVLLMGHDFQSWWIGSLLSIEEARRLVPHQNATTLQVACSVLGAVAWMINHPQEGVCVPDQLPYEDILTWAKPYLGEFVSRPVNWNPLMNRKDIELFSKFHQFSPKFTDDDMWQFTTFQVS